MHSGWVGGEQKDKTYTPLHKKKEKKKKEKKKRKKKPCVGILATAFLVWLIRC